jgi:hypothetical protein
MSEAGQPIGRSFLYSCHGFTDYPPKTPIRKGARGREGREEGRQYSIFNKEYSMLKAMSKETA